MSKKQAYKFLVLDGQHHVSDTVKVKKGETLISDDRLDVIYGKSKFELVETVCCKDPESCTECKVVEEPKAEEPKVEAPKEDEKPKTEKKAK
jgi:hypothetical protein